MHIDYAKETMQAFRNQKNQEPATDMQILKFLATDEIVDLASVVGDEKTRSIAETMKNSFGYRKISSKGYKKITDKQRFAIAASMLAMFGNIENVLAQAFKVESSYFA